MRVKLDPPPKFEELQVGDKLLLDYDDRGYDHVVLLYKGTFLGHGIWDAVSRFSAASREVDEYNYNRRCRAVYRVELDAAALKKLELIHEVFHTTTAGLKTVISPGPSIQVSEDNPGFVRFVQECINKIKEDEQQLFEDDDEEDDFCNDDDEDDAEEEPLTDLLPSEDSSVLRPVDLEHLKPLKEHCKAIGERLAKIYGFPFQRQPEASAPTITATEAIKRLEEKNVDFTKSIISKLRPDSCQHEYIPYQGLMESYEFCKKCDHKR